MKLILKLIAFLLEKTSRFKSNDTLMQRESKQKQKDIAEEIRSWWRD